MDGRPIWCLIILNEGSLIAKLRNRVPASSLLHRCLAFGHLTRAAIQAVFALGVIVSLRSTDSR